MAQAWPVPRHRGALWLCPCGRNHAFFERSPLSFGRYHASRVYTAHSHGVPTGRRYHIRNRSRRKGAKRWLFRWVRPWSAQAIPVFVFCLVQFRECTLCRQQQVRVAWRPGDWSRWGHYTSERMRQITYALDVKTGVERGNSGSKSSSRGASNAQITDHMQPRNP